MSSPTPFPAPPVAPPKPYLSFLACVHEQTVNLYLSGNPIGIIKDGIFAVHQYAVGDTVRPIRFSDLSHPVPYQSVDELKAALKDMIDLIDLPMPPKPENKS
jgi:hypothetical protein